MPITPTAALEDAINVWVAETRIIALGAAKVWAPKRTGHFAESLFAVTSGSGLRRRIEIKSMSLKPKSIWLRAGTRPHMIFPRRKLALAWPVSQGGVGGDSADYYYAAYVFHPGTKPHHWAEKAVALIRAPAIASLRKIVLQSLRESLMSGKARK